ncbi:PR-1-like protein [Mycena kentingensis (nom. inval.)]|nr:PR-1-like protein [Mycena kentingensis (nom. inval.)]
MMASRSRNKFRLLSGGSIALLLAAVPAAVALACSAQPVWRPGGNQGGGQGGGHQGGHQDGQSGSGWQLTTSYMPGYGPMPVRVVLLVLVQAQAAAQAQAKVQAQVRATVQAQAPAKVQVLVLDNSGAGSGSSNPNAQQYLDAHNSVRSAHGANALVWDDKLASAAQNWAYNCKFEHSQGAVGPYGENLAAGTGSYSPAQGVQDWANEASEYNPNNPQFSHFTQMVWKATTNLGCAVATCGGIFDSGDPAQFYVCEYDPPGNVQGQYAQNVQA